MTDELTKTFFDTFGIEPKQNRPCEQLLQNKYCNENSGTRDTFFDPYPYCVGFENCAKDYKARVWVYPKITDRILLELICIYNVFVRMDFYSSYVKDLKIEVLETLIKEYKNRKQTGAFDENLKEKVQALFKEG